MNTEKITALEKSWAELLKGPKKLLECMEIIDKGIKIYTAKGGWQLDDISKVK